MPSSTFTHSKRTLREADTTARTQMPVQPAGEVERREQLDAQDKTQKPVMPPHTEAQVSPSGYLDRDEIASLAYEFWLNRQGRGTGDAEQDWLRAEAELRKRRV